MAIVEYYQRMQYSFNVDDTMFLFAHVKLSTPEVLRTYVQYMNAEKKKKELEDAKKLEAQNQEKKQDEMQDDMAGGEDDAPEEEKDIFDTGFVRLSLSLLDEDCGLVDNY